MTPALEPVRRIAAYGVCTDDGGRVLLVRAAASSGTPGAWSLPGGAVSHGEHPLDTVVRETAAETGLSVAVAGLRDVLADMRALPHRGITIHTDRLIYGVTVRGGNLCDTPALEKYMQAVAVVSAPGSALRAPRLLEAGRQVSK